MTNKTTAQSITLKTLDGDFAVCKYAALPALSGLDNPYFFAQTEEEISLVCRETCLPEGDAAIEKGWKGLVVAGQLDFSLIGIIAGISRALAEAGVSVFVASTYDTDYLFVRSAQFDQALKALASAGYTVL